MSNSREVSAADRAVPDLRFIVPAANENQSLTWESVPTAYSGSTHPWVAATARAWLTQLDSLVPHVDARTVWNEVPDDAAGFELALRARIVWLSGRMDSWCDLDQLHVVDRVISAADRSG